MIKKIKVIVKNEALALSLGVQPGDKVAVECKNGTPISREWRNRFKDSEYDECIVIPKKKVEIVKQTKPTEDK